MPQPSVLVTITPNWHMRPSDVTVKFCPPRTEAVGFHLKEYKLAEICELTHAAGFRAIRAPAFISRRRIYDLRWASFTRAKKRLEPLLERLEKLCDVAIENDQPILFQ